jgi:hypothetical protein
LRYFLFCVVSWVPALWAQTLPLEIGRGEREGTVVIAVPAGGAMEGQLELVYRVMGAGGEVLDQAAETIPVRVAASQAVRFVRPLPVVAGAVELRVALTVRPAGTQFAGTMALGGATFQVDTNVALVPVQVQKSAGSFLTDLGAEEIRVLEDGVAREAELQIVGRQGPAAVPVDITLLYDRSGSMGDAGAYGAEVFRKGLLDEFPNVRIAIYGFSDQLVRFTAHTRDVEVLNRASGLVASIAPRSTPLFSSISRTMGGFDLARPAVRVLMVLSDGVASPFDLETSGSVLQTARRAGVAIYPVLVATPMPAKAPLLRPPPPPRPRTTSKKKGEPQPVNETADVEMRRLQRTRQTMGDGMSIAGYRRLAESGGQLLTALPTGNSLPGLFAEIAKTLRYSYVASYRPSKGTREVKVELVDRKRGKVIGGVRTVVR